MDFFVATALILIFVLLSWVYGRGLSGGRTLNPFKRRLLIYASIFAAGMIYLMLVVSDLHWRKELVFPLIGLWAIVVGLVAWFRYRRERAHRASEHQPPATFH
jgi:DMSO/TMAO reductase YedYZ heme-binding membrane subunit